MREVRCAACNHPQRAAIDEELVRGCSVRSTAARFGGLSRAGLQRHKQRHLPATLVQSERIQEVVRVEVLSGTLLNRVEAQVSKADHLLAEVEAVLATAKASGDTRTVLSAVKTAALALKEARNGAELVGRLAGELREGGAQLNIVASPEWAVLRCTITEALAPYPEALAAVARALRDADGRPGAHQREIVPALPAGGVR